MLELNQELFEGGDSAKGMELAAKEKVQAALQDRVKRETNKAIVEDDDCLTIAHDERNIEVMLYVGEYPAELEQQAKEWQKNREKEQVAGTVTWDAADQGQMPARLVRKLAMAMRLVCKQQESFGIKSYGAVSYTHLTLPTNREV